MIIKADKEAKNLIIAVCDMARKVCNLADVKMILNLIDSIEEVGEDGDKEPQK